MRAGCVHLLVVAASCLAICGCVREKVNGGTTVYDFESWTWLAAGAGGLGLVAAGWLMSESAWWRRGGVALIGVILLVVLVPGMLTDRLEVDNDHFHIRTGLWFNQVDHDIRFDDIQRMELTSKSRWSRRGKRTSYDLAVYHRSGAIENVPVGDLMKAGLVNIADRARMHGAEVVDRTEQDE